MKQQTLIATEKWENQLRKRGIMFAQIQTYDAFYSKAAILSRSTDRMTVQYPVTCYPKRAFAKAGNPCAISGTHPIKFRTETISNDCDVTIRELL